MESFIHSGSTYKKSKSFCSCCCSEWPIVRGWQCPTTMNKRVPLKEKREWRRLCLKLSICEFPDKGTSICPYAQIGMVFHIHVSVLFFFRLWHFTWWSFARKLGGGRRGNKSGKATVSFGYPMWLSNWKAFCIQKTLITLAHFAPTTVVYLASKQKSLTLNLSYGNLSGKYCTSHVMESPCLDYCWTMIRATGKLDEAWDM